MAPEQIKVRKDARLRVIRRFMVYNAGNTSDRLWLETGTVVVCGKIKENDPREIEIRIVEPPGNNKLRFAGIEELEENSVPVRSTARGASVHEI
mgnify:CR=1 FL=1